MELSTKLAQYLFDRNRGLILLLISAALLIYIPYLSNPFFFDDLSFFTTANVNYYSNQAIQLSLRWLPNYTIVWTYAHFSDIPHIYRLTNLLIHICNVIVLFFLLRRLSILIRSNTKTNFISWGAWLGALVFACHPIAVYAVGYMIQRSIIMATLFSLAMQLCYLRGFAGEGKRWFILSVIFYLLAVLSKEQSIMAPAIILAETILLYQFKNTDKQSLWLTWLGFLIISIVAISLTAGVLGVSYEHDASQLLEQQHITAPIENSSIHLHLLSVLTQAGLFFKYLLLWAVPNTAWMSVDMRETFISSLTLWKNWFGLIAFILYGAFSTKLLFHKGKSGLTGLALLYPWLFYMVEFSTIRIQEPFVLYRSYLWLPGMLLLIPIALQIINRKTIFIGFTLLTLLLIPLSWNRLWVFADSYRLWNDAAILLKNDHVGGSARIFYNRGNAELANNQWVEALADFGRVIAINPKIEQAQSNIGIAYFGLADYQNAIDAFDRAISLKPDYAYAYYAKAMCFKKLHRDDAAMDLMKQSCTYGNITACMIVTSFSK